jgi:CUG-BP- and ETR3-like factor
MPNAGPMQQSSLFGALQMGYMPQYSGFGYQVSCAYSLNFFRILHALQ